MEHAGVSVFNILLCFVFPVMSCSSCMSEHVDLCSCAVSTMDLSLEHRTEQFDTLRMGGPPSSKYSILSSHPVEQIVEKVGNSF